MKQMFIAILVLAGCGSQQVKLEPVKIEPIHMTIDVNVRDSPDPATTPATKLAP